MYWWRIREMVLFSIIDNHYYTDIPSTALWHITFSLPFVLYVYIQTITLIDIVKTVAGLWNFIALNTWTTRKLVTQNSCVLYHHLMPRLIMRGDKPSFPVRVCLGVALCVIKHLRHLFHDTQQFDIHSAT